MKTMTTEERISWLLQDPDRLLQKKPFTRGGDIIAGASFAERSAPVGSTVRASLPRYERTVVPQERFLMELDPNTHDVLFDDNIPSICVKTNKGGTQEQRFEKAAVPFQRIIKDKKLLHLSGLPMKFTLVDKKPTDRQQEDFIVFKQYWDLRNQDGMKTKMVDAALSMGDAGLLYYYDNRGRIKSRLLSFADGYVLCPHNDDNGDRILESIYYRVGDTEYIDSYDDTFMYRYTTSLSDGGVWKLDISTHGFSEIPLVTKRTKVAWDDVQNLIQSYETLYNVFNVIQKKWGWGMLYVKGKIDEKARKIAGNIVLNDTSIDNANNDAKFLTPPDPQNMINTLDNIYYRIQEGSGCTFVLPKDIHTSSDTSGLAVKLTMSLDIQTAKQGVIEWQNVADKMVRLFKEGLAKELVAEGIDPTAVTDFANLHVNAVFDIWEPYSEEAYNNMICTMVNTKIISQRTGVEVNSISRPDEMERIKKEKDEESAQTATQAEPTATPAQEPDTGDGEADE